MSGEGSGAEMLTLLAILVLHLALTALPAVAAALLGARLGVASVSILLALALAASALIGIVSFWAYYGDPLLGQSLAFLVALGSIALIVWLLLVEKVDPRPLGGLWSGLALWALGSFFLVFLGFVHGGTDHPLELSAIRFFGPLPGDNAHPLVFSEWFYGHGHDGHPPPITGWLSSDRPPLQVGYVLSQRPFDWDPRGLNYQVLGVVLQQLWIVGLWALLLAAGVSRITRALTATVALVSGLALLNGFFVWPKMLPAALLLAAAALVLTPLWKEVRRSLWGAVLLASLCGLALLGHGASAFGVIPLALVAAVRGLPSWRWIGVAALVGLVLMAPWSAYQKYGDPPGNRLAKWTLAGVSEIDDRGILEATVDAYSEAGVGGAIHNKGQNFVSMAGGGPAVESLKGGFESGSASEMVRSTRSVFFFYFLPSMGLLLLAPVAMALARRRGRERSTEWSFALLCFAVVAIGVVAWGLLTFGSVSMRTVLHVGSYLLPLLAMCGAVAGLRAALPEFAVYWVGAQAVLSLALYVPLLDPPPGTSYSALAAVVAAAALAGFCICALRAPDPWVESRA